MDEALITYSHVEVHQQELCVLSEVNLELNKGDFVYLIGKVGSGKTSLLKTFYAELGIAEGEAVVLGNDMRTIKRKHIPQLRRKLGIVFQDFQLLTDRSVYDNLEFVLRATGWKNKQEIKDRIEEVLQQVGMSNKGSNCLMNCRVVSNSASLSRGLYLTRPKSYWQTNPRGISMWKPEKPLWNCFTASAGKGLRW